MLQIPFILNTNIFPIVVDDTQGHSAPQPLGLDQIIYCAVVSFSICHREILGQCFGLGHQGLCAVPPLLLSTQTDSNCTVGVNYGASERSEY